jgi:hypothetical protein
MAATVPTIRPVFSLLAMTTSRAEFYAMVMCRHQGYGCAAAAVPMTSVATRRWAMAGHFSYPPLVYIGRYIASVKAFVA